MVTPDRRVGDRSQPVQPDDSHYERLGKLIYANFGNNWRQQLTLQVSGDVLSWVIRLAEVGLETKRSHFATSSLVRPSEAAASLADWDMNIGEVVKAAEEYFRSKKQPKKG
jgi:hypothetical protein